jgi:hypothetical protein
VADVQKIFQEYAIELYVELLIVQELKIDNKADQNMVLVNKLP